jgi:hypothetical protein
MSHEFSISTIKTTKNQQIAREVWRIICLEREAERKSWGAGNLLIFGCI